MVAIFFLILRIQKNLIYQKSSKLKTFMILQILFFGFNFKSYQLKKIYNLKRKIFGNRLSVKVLF